VPGRGFFLIFFLSTAGAVLSAPGTFMEANSYQDDKNYFCTGKKTIRYNAVLTIVSKEWIKIFFENILAGDSCKNKRDMVTHHFRVAIIHKQKENVNKIVVIFFLYRKNYF
jgi:hypothetical protein